MFEKLFGNRRESSPARDENEAVFDWRSLPAIEPEAFDGWFGCTDAKDRQLPFQIALQVHDELEEKMMIPGKMDALALSEIRGGMKALSRYCRIYQAILDGDRRK